MARFKKGDKIVFTVHEVTNTWYRFWEEDGSGWVIDLKGADKFGEPLEDYLQHEATGSAAVNHPSHYCGKIETIDFIEDKLGDGFVPYCLGNVMKYISRYDKKGRPEEDLQKAAKYLEWAIRKLGEGNDGR